MSAWYFETPRLYIREYKTSDINDYLRVVRQQEVYATTYGIPKDYPKSRAKKWFKFIKNNIKTMQSFEFGMFDICDKISCIYERDKRAGDLSQ